MGKLMSMLPVIGDVASQGGNMISSMVNTKRTIKANKEMAKYAYSKDLEMWNKGNEYNTPEAQMQRLEKAGLNPNMVYGTGTVSGNSAQSLPKYQAPRQEYKYIAPMDLGNTMQRYQDIEMRTAQIDTIKKQIEKTNVEIANELLRGRIMATDSERKMFDLGILKNLAPYTLERGQLGVESLKQQIENAKASGALTSSKINTESLRQSIMQPQLKLEQFKAGLSDFGATTSDNVLVRMLLNLLGKTKIKDFIYK